MKISTLLFAVIIAASMTSCNDVPEDVRSRTEAKNQAISEAEKHLEERTGEIRYISPDKLEDDIKAALGQSYANFTVDPSVKISVPKEIVKCDFKQTDGFDSNADKLCERIFGKGSISDIEESTHRSWNHEFNCCGFRNNEERKHLSIWNNGFLCFMKPLLFEEMVNNGQRAAIYHVDRGDDLSAKYLLGEKEISVEDGVAAAQKWLDDNYADLEPEYKIRIKTVIVRQDDNGAYAFEFTADRLYNGIELDELIDVIDTNDTHGRMIPMVYQKYRILMIMKSAGDIDYFTNLSGILAPEKKGTLEKVVSLKSALEYAERQFSDFQNPLTINSIGLKYLISPQYDHEHEIPYNKENTVSTGHIVWEFILDVPMEQLKDGTGKPINEHLGDVRRYIYIDAETGEMEFNFSIPNLIQ